MEGEVALIDGVQGEENDRGYAKVLGLSDQGQRNQPHFKRGQKPGSRNILHGRKRLSLSAYSGLRR